MTTEPSSDSDKAGLSVRFWGVRGSVSTPDAATSRYGGNTSSIEVDCGGKPLLLDAGTGLRYLGNALQGRGGTWDLDLLLTHTHFDHVCGIPFFKPFFNPENRFRLWAGHLLPDHTLRSVLEDMMIAPLFPVPPGIFPASVEYRDFAVGTTLDLGPDIRVRTAPLNHPNGATGYRIEHAGRSVCYLTDTEHDPEALDETIIELIRDADLVIYDCTYTDAEFPNRVGWGHSTWEEGCRLCDAAAVETLVIFHHDPDHDDDFMDAIATAAEARRPGTVVAREGLVIEL